jgi:hypothetical protein
MKAGEFMKYTRLEIYKGISNSKLKTLLGFFILIPVIAVITGSIITRIFIPNEKSNNFTEYEDKTIVVSNQNTTIDYKIFFLQAGAFISKNNADVLKDAIKRDDIDPVVIEDDTIYRVIIDLSDNKEFLTQKKDKLQTLGYNCLINEFAFASIESVENEEIKNTNNLIETVVDIIKLQVKLNNDFTNLDTNNLEILKNYIVELNDKYIELEKFNISSLLKTFKDNFEQYTNDYIKSYENRVLNICQQKTADQVLIFNNFYKEVVQITIK